MKNAFTLVEILGVILLLGLIVIVTTTVISGVGNDSKNSLYESQKEIVIDAARKWTVQNDYKITSTYEVSLNDLYTEGFLKSNTIRDPRNKNNKLCGNVIITRNNTTNKYTYTYNPTSQPTCN